MKTIRSTGACIIGALVILVSICNNAQASSIILLSGGLEYGLDSGSVDRPRLNNYGEVVWSKRLEGSTYRVYSSSNGLVSSGINYRDPDINDHGEIIWRFGDGGSGPNGIESSLRGVIFTSAHIDPYYDTQRINNNSEIIASRYGGSQVWSSTRGNLPTYGSFDRQTELNDNGEVVSRVFNGPNGNTFDIYSTERGAITNDGIWQYNPDINNIGEIVWDQNGQVWSDLRGMIGFGSNPAINDLGEIVWSSGGDIYSNVRGQLTFDIDNDLYPQIANNSDVTFLRSSTIPSVVPVPGAFWLFAVGSLFLFGRLRSES